MTFIPAGYTQEAPLQIKALLSGGTYTVKKVTILSGQNLVEGAIIGKVTASSKYKLSAAAAGDGSETPDLVTMYPVDASGGDKESMVLETCTQPLNKEALVVGAGLTVAGVREGLRAKGILISD